MDLESISRSTDKNLIKEWLKKHPLTLVQNNHQQTLIHLASMNGNLDVIRQCLKKKYVNIEEIRPLNLRDKDGYTPLHCAVNQGHFELSEKLLSKGSDPNARTATGSTPLHLLSRYCHSQKAIKFATQLIEAGAFINHKDIKFEAPLHRAVLPTNNNEFLKLLLLNGANPNILNKRGRTPIHVAIEEGRIDILLIFMEHGALFTKSSLNSSFPSPLEFALQSKNPLIVQFFNERIGVCGEYIIWMEKLNLFYGKYMQSFAHSGDSYNTTQYIQLIHGGLFITNYRLVFRCENTMSIPNKSKYSLHWPFGEDEEMNIPLSSIESITTENHLGINHQSNVNSNNNNNNNSNTNNSNNNNNGNTNNNNGPSLLGGSGGSGINNINSSSSPNLGGSGNSESSSNWGSISGNNNNNINNSTSINNSNSNNNQEKENEKEKVEKVDDDIEQIIHRLNNNTSSSYLYLSKDDFWTGSDQIGGIVSTTFSPSIQNTSTTTTTPYQSNSTLSSPSISLSPSPSSSFLSGQHCELNINNNGQIVNSTPINYYSIIIHTKNFKHCKLYFLNSAMRDKVVDIITYHYKTKVEKTLKLIDTNRRLQNKIVMDNINLEDHSRVEHIDRFECYGVFEEPLPYFYAHVYRAQRPAESDGWLVYQPKKEYARFGIHEDQPGVLQNLYWKVSLGNKDFKICSTYPPTMVVSRVMLEKDIEKVANYRSKGRIPVLSWRAPNGSCITRCSQPLVGLASSRCSEDELYINTIANGKPMYILDARPKLNAIANTANGAGFENIGNYGPTCKLVFLNIANIHVMRKSLEKLVSSLSQFNGQIENPMNVVEESGWLHHIKGVLSGALFAAELITKGANILVHCSDGWDRTPQLTSLAQIMLDPYYRTIIGLEVLIEKEWLSFGHKFAHRLGHLHESEDEQSPIFIQFLDAIFQLVNQFPLLFEYTPSLLLFIAEHIYSCKYGTFLHNCEQERMRDQVKTKTVSIWTDVNLNMEYFTNPYFMSNQQGIILRPNLNIRCIELWKSLYMNYETQNTWLFNNWMVSKSIQQQQLHSLQFKQEREKEKERVEKERLEKEKEKQQQNKQSTTPSTPSTNQQQLPSLKVSTTKIRASSRFHKRNYSSNNSDGVVLEMVTPPSSSSSTPMSSNESNSTSSGGGVTISIPNNVNGHHQASTLHKYGGHLIVNNTIIQTPKPRPLPSIPVQQIFLNNSNNSSNGNSNSMPNSRSNSNSSGSSNSTVGSVFIRSDHHSRSSSSSSTANSSSNHGDNTSQPKHQLLGSHRPINPALQ